MEPFRPVRTVSRATGGGGGGLAGAGGCPGGGGGGGRAGPAPAPGGGNGRAAGGGPPKAGAGGAVVVPAHAAATTGSKHVRTASTRRKSLEGMMLRLRRRALVARRRVRLPRGVEETPPGRPNSRSR